ncbi:MAG: protein rep [Alphaproteobacteria bacterium]|nr:protein rep [Alphaproteobacteria bacterium]
MTVHQKFLTATPIERRVMAINLKRAATFELAHAVRQASQDTNPDDATWFARIADRMEACAASYRAYTITPENDATYLKVSHKRACHKDVLCDLCAGKTSRRRVRQFASDVECIVAEQPSLPFVLATFTLPNEPLDHLSDMLDSLDRAYAKLMRRASIKRAVRGSIASKEIAIRRDDKDQPMSGGHLHAMWVMHADYFDRSQDLYIDQAELTRLWSECAEAGPGKKYIVDIRRIRDARGKTNPNAVYRGLKEVLKYQTKPSSVVRMTPHGLEADPTVAVALLKATYRRRMVRTAGLFLSARKKRLALKAEEDLL